MRNLHPSLKNKIQHFIETEKSTPRFLFSEETLIFNYKYLKQIFNFLDSDIYYSVKTNNFPNILERLYACGAGFEIASVGELKMLENLKINPDKIICSNPVKIPEHLAAMHKYGVKTFAFDSISELEKINKYEPHSNVFLRLAISNAGASWELTKKFGASLNDVLVLAKHAKKLNLDFCGLAIHVGWNNQNADTWFQTIKQVTEVIDELSRNDFQLEFLNLGGGFPAHNVDQYKTLEIIWNKISELINQVRNHYNMRVICEPGSFLVANAGVLMLRIYDIIERQNTKWIFVDSGICQGFYWILSGLQYPIIYPYKISTETKLETFTITGPTMDSHDIFAENIMLPQKISIGDYLFVAPGGAYTNSAINYNGFSYPELEYQKMV